MDIIRITLVQILGFRTEVERSGRISAMLRKELQETALWGLLYLDFAPVFHQGNENMISLGKHYKNNFQKFNLATALESSASLKWLNNIFWKTFAKYNCREFFSHFYIVGFKRPNWIIAENVTKAIAILYFIFITYCIFLYFSLYINIYFLI